MDSCRLEVHPAYGAIPRDGDEVGRGEVIGLSADSRFVIIAPISGKVKLHQVSEAPTLRLYVEIEPDPALMRSMAA